MTPVAQYAAKAYTPSTPAAQAAAVEFIDAAKKWGSKYAEARDELRDFVRVNVDGEVRGFVSRDPLNMAVFGLVFDRSPAQGFIAVPSAVSEGLREQGLRGQAYFPDTNHPVGKQVMARMNQLSRVAEQRPLLNKVPGMASVGLEGGRAVLSRAERSADGSVVVRVAPSALRPGVELTPVAAAEDAAKLTQAVISRAKPRA